MEDQLNAKGSYRDDVDTMDEEKKKVVVDYFVSWANNEFKTLFEYLSNSGGKYEDKKSLMIILHLY